MRICQDGSSLHSAKHNMPPATASITSYIAIGALSVCSIYGVTLALKSRCVTRANTGKRVRSSACAKEQASTTVWSQP